MAPSIRAGNRTGKCIYQGNNILFETGSAVENASYQLTSPQERRVGASSPTAAGPSCKGRPLTFQGLAEKEKRNMETTAIVLTNVIQWKPEAGCELQCE